MFTRFQSSVSVLLICCRSPRRGRVAMPFPTRDSPRRADHNQVCEWLPDAGGLRKRQDPAFTGPFSPPPASRGRGRWTPSIQQSIASLNHGGNIRTPPNIFQMRKVTDKPKTVNQFLQFLQQEDNCANHQDFSQGSIYDPLISMKFLMAPVVAQKSRHRFISRQHVVENTVVVFLRHSVGLAESCRKIPKSVAGAR